MKKKTIKEAKKVSTEATATMREEATETLRRLWDEGIKSGPAIDGEQAFASLRMTLDARFSGRDRS